VLALQRSAGNAAVAALVSGSEGRSPVLDVIGRGGVPLSEPIRTEMESRLGHDFSDVRIHTGHAASEAARSVNAAAFTAGRDVVFAHGQFAPHTTAGKTTLAHELAHVVQQRRGRVDATPVGGGIALSDPSDRFEREAERAADEAMAAPVQRTADEAMAAPVQRERDDRSRPARRWSTAGGIATVQRKVGFELEDDFKSVMVMTRPLTKEEEKLRKQGLPPPFDPIRAPDCKPVPKGVVLKRGDKFELQADEKVDMQQGRRWERGDLEFVTSPLDETKPDEVRAVARGIKEMCAEIHRTAVNPGQWRFPGQHPFGGSLLLLAPDEWSFKVQFTADIRKAHLGQVMEDFGSPEGEQPANTTRRQPGRQMLMGPTVAGTGRKVMGSAPGLARQAIAALDQRVGGGTFSAANTRQLTGLLAIMVQYVKMGSMSIPSYAKVIAPLMSRHDLAKLFRSLPQAQRNYLASGGGQPLEALLLDAAGRVSLHGKDNNYAADRPVFRELKPDVVDPSQPGGTRSLQVLSDVKIGTWAREITLGRDLLSMAGYESWLREGLGTTPMSEVQVVGIQQLESLGAKGKASRYTNSAGKKGFAFEMRAASRMVPLDEIDDYMVSVTEYFRGLAAEQNDLALTPARNPI
jgi:hypothetical protein